MYLCTKLSLQSNPQKLYAEFILGSLICVLVFPDLKVLMMMFQPSRMVSPTNTHVTKVTMKRCHVRIFIRPLLVLKNPQNVICPFSAFVVLVLRVRCN